MNGTGLIITHDIGHEDYLAKDGVLRGVDVDEFKPRTKVHRQWKRFDQGNTPRCTGFGLATILATSNKYTRSKVTGDEWYFKNVAWDKAHGNDFGDNSGATVTATMEVAKDAGVISRYEWMYTMKSMQQSILIAPLVAGTNWYREMWNRDSEGIVQMKADDRGTSAGGHLFILRGYDAKRDLWINPETWGDGDYLIPGELMHRLLRESGEVSIITEGL